MSDPARPVSHPSHARRSARRGAPPPHARRVSRQRNAFRLDARAIRAALTGSLIGAVGFVVLFGVTLLSLYLYFQASGHILLGVRVGDVRLGNQSIEQASLTLEDAWRADRNGLVLTDGSRRWNASPAEFGLTLDAQATARRAQAVGRGSGMGHELAILISAFLTGQPVAPAVSLDAEVARAGLEAWVETVNQPPRDATIRFEGERVVAVPSEPGSALDVDATLGALSADPERLMRNGSLPLVMTPVEPQIADASDAVAEAERLLSAPLAVTTYDPISDERIQWSAPPAVIATWLAVDVEDDELRVTVDPDRLGDYVAGLSESLGAGRYVEAEETASMLLEGMRSGTSATLLVRHEPTAYTVQAGDTLIGIAWRVGMPFWRIADANPGVDIDALVPGQVLTIPSKDDLLPLPVVANKRIVVSISEQRLWVYEDGQLLSEHVISTGIRDSPTQPGIFQVQTHEVYAYASIWDLWMPHFLGIYEAWPGFMNGFHGLPTLSSGVRLWADILGRPASYGCIILDLDDAEWLYTWADPGVVVEIKE